mgnify:CR=1 FL=1
MGKPTGFMEYPRELPQKRPVGERIRDYFEIYQPMPEAKLQEQGARCMDCGVPFCHEGCPLGNLIPDWNDLVYRGHWREAIDRLHATNNFPEFTGKLCPAPCEGSCVLAINEPAVTIKQIEWAIIERAWAEGWVHPQPATVSTGKRVAIVGSGPAGLAAAQQLARAGHVVSVFERDDRIGGLLRYGIPDFKMHKRLLDRRLEQMAAEGVTFHPNTEVGRNPDGATLRKEFDAVVLACGATRPRDLSVPGRELAGVHFAMEYLPLQNRRNAGDTVDDATFITAAGKRVVILGGGDTGADCLGTAHRQGAREVYQYEIMPQPPEARRPDNPWPEWPHVLMKSPAHEEGGQRDYALMTTGFSGRDGRVEKLHAVRIEWVEDRGKQVPRPIAGTEIEQEVDLVLLAMGFTGPDSHSLFEQLGVKLSHRGTVGYNRARMSNVPGVFTAGDAAIGQSLIVTAISEGRRVAHHVDAYLCGESHLPLLPD